VGSLKCQLLTEKVTTESLSQDLAESSGKISDLLVELESMHSEIEVLKKKRSEALKHIIPISSSNFSFERLTKFLTFLSQSLTALYRLSLSCPPPYPDTLLTWEKSLHVIRAEVASFGAYCEEKTN